MTLCSHKVQLYCMYNIHACYPQPSLTVRCRSYMVNYRTLHRGVMILARYGNERSVTLTVRVEIIKGRPNACQDHSWVK